MIGAAPGGTYDLSARIIARNIPAYLGANWSVVVSNIAGAGSLNAANFVLKNSSNREPMIAALAAPVVMNSFINPSSTAAFDATSFYWLGSTAAGESYCVTTHNREKNRPLESEMILGATSSGSPSSTYAYLLSHLVGPKMKVVHGYQGAQDLLLAIDRNEIDAFCSFSLGGIEDLWKDRLASGDLHLMYAFPNSTRQTTYKNSINALELVKPEDIEAVRTFLSQQSFSEPYGVPASMSATTRTALRLAFEKTIASDEFRSAQNRKIAATATANGEEVTTAMSKIINASPETQARIQQIVTR